MHRTARNANRTAAAAIAGRAPRTKAGSLAQKRKQQCVLSAGVAESFAQIWVSR
jgi:hypothetical protein